MSEISANLRGVMKIISDKQEPKPRVRRAKKPTLGVFQGLVPMAPAPPFYTTPEGGEFVPERAVKRMTIEGLADEYKENQWLSSECDWNYLAREWGYWDYARAHGLLDERL